MQATILDRLTPQYDAIVEDTYRAGSGLQPWLRPIERVAHVFDAWAVQLLGVNKQTGLGLIPISTHGDQVALQDRRVVRLKRKDGHRVAATLIALRPESTMGSFGRTPQALFTVFEPGAPVDIDPFILSTTFDLTPAEARVAAMIVGGGSPERCAEEFSVKISTVRSQLVSIYRKTGATGQADLVRMILSATTL